MGHWTTKPCTRGTCDKAQLSPPSPAWLDQDLKIHKHHPSPSCGFFRPGLSCRRSSTMKLNNSATPWALGKVSENGSGAAASRRGQNGDRTGTGSTHLPARGAAFIIYALSTLRPHIFFGPWQCFPRYSQGYAQEPSYSQGLSSDLITRFLS